MFLTPRWILSHLFVAALVGTCIAAGLWQVNRLAERQDANAVIEDRASEAPVAVAALADIDPDDAEYVPVRLRGSYGDQEILVANRSNDGTPGFWMWTEFDLDAGGSVIVNRGFVSRAIVQGAAGASALSDTAPPDADVDLIGRLRTGLDSGRLSDDATEVSRPDPELVGEVFGTDSPLSPAVYVELVTQAPPQQSEQPIPIPDPDLSEGPHRSYAFQWFSFATIGIVGYAILLRRIRRGDVSRGDVPLSGV